jgi:Rrf2 family protein
VAGFSRPATSLRAVERVQVSAKADYGVRALIELAAERKGHSTEDSRRPLKGEQLAASQQLPAKFLEAILAELRQAGLVHSRRGADGGYWLARPPNEITVADIMRVTDGPLASVRGQLPETVFYRGAAERLSEVWVAVRASLRDVLERVTLADLVDGRLPAHVRAMAADPDAWVSHLP